MSVSPIPEGYHSITPYLIVKGAAAAMEYYKKAFGATEIMRMPDGKGKIMHAEMKIGTSRIMLADESPANNAYSPGHYSGSPITLMLYVEDVDATFAKAVAEGASIKRPLADQFYGDRTGGLTDPFGHRWYLGTHIRDVSREEMKEAMASMAS
jgi:PhnB protein